MIKDKISVIISNLKFNIAYSKISLNAIKRFFILIIDNKYIKNRPILQFLLRVLAGSIDISSYFFYWKVKNSDDNNKSNKSEIEEKIKFKNKMNQNKLIYQIDRAIS